MSDRVCDVFLIDRHRLLDEAECSEYWQRVCRFVDDYWDANVSELTPRQYAWLERIEEDCRR